MASNIRIRNLYHMLSYAYQSLHEIDKSHVSAEDFDNVHNFFAAILIQGTSSQIKRGLHRDYIPQEETLSGLRGQIQISNSVKQQSMTQKKLICAFDEFTVDSYHNQVLKCTLSLLLRKGSVRELNRKSLRKLLLYFGDVSDVDPISIRWNALRYQRNSIAYKTLLENCRFVIEGLLLTTEAGEYHLPGWIQDEAMHRLYERFVLEYYKRRHPEFSPKAAHIDWNLSEPAEITYLSTMKSDITLNGNNKTLIIDTKYYGKSMQHHSLYDSTTFISGNLYQIFSYVKNCDRGGSGNVAGVLLYAKTDEMVTPDNTFNMGGNPISLKTLDFDNEWTEITMQLESLCDWLRE